MSNKTVVKPIKNPPVFEHDDMRKLVNLAFFEDTVYLCYQKIYKLVLSGFIRNEDSAFSWNQVADIPFTQRSGQKMISVPRGIVFFGGEDEDNIVYNDLWYWDGKNWDYLATNVPPLISPAACYAGDHQLLIHGGLREDKSFTNTDFYFIDLETSATKQISLDFPLQLHSHTITLLSNGKFLLYGGTSPEGVSSKLYIIDFEAKTFERIESPYEIATTGHYTAEIYTLLFCIGGYDSQKKPQSTWLFNFDHNIWFKYKPDVNFDGVFVYTSTLVGNGVAFHCISRNYDTFLTYSISKNTPNCNIKDTQSFTKFVSNQLKYSIQEFTIPSRKNTIDNRLVEIRDQFLAKACDAGVSQDVIENSKTVFDDLDKLNEVKFRIISLKSSIKNQPKISNLRNVTPSHYDRDKYVELRKFIEQSKIERKAAREKAISLSEKIDHLSFSNYVANIRNSRPLDCTNEDVDRKLAKSQQLAQLIASMREEKETHLRHRQEESRQEMESARTEVVLLDQIGASWEEADRLRMAANEAKEECLRIVAKLILLRIEILNQIVDYPLSTRMELVAQQETPSKCLSVNKMIQKKRSLIRNLDKMINELFVNSHKSDAERIGELQLAVENIGAWASAAKEVCTEVKKPIPQLGNVPRENFAIEKIDIFISSLADWEYDFELKDYTPFIVRQPETPK